MKTTRTILTAVLLLGCMLSQSSCDIGNPFDDPDTYRPPCDYTPYMVLNAGKNVLTEEDDMDPEEPGIQHPVSLYVDGLEGGTTIQLRAGPGNALVVVAELTLPEDFQSGDVDFGNITFQEGGNEVCINHMYFSDKMVDSDQKCKARMTVIENCVHVEVSLEL